MHYQILSTFLNIFNIITSKKYIIKITLIFSNDCKIDSVVLFDISAYLNCIKEWIVLKQFLQSTSEKLFAANNTKLVIEYKTQALIFNNEFYLYKKIITNNINHTVILVIHFIDMITTLKN